MVKQERPKNLKQLESQRKHESGKGQWSVIFKKVPRNMWASKQTTSTQSLEKYEYQEIETYLKSYRDLRVFFKLLAPACNSSPFRLFSAVFTAFADCLLKGWLVVVDSCVFCIGESGTSVKSLSLSRSAAAAYTKILEKNLVKKRMNCTREGWGVAALVRWERKVDEDDGGVWTPETGACSSSRSSRLSLFAYIKMLAKN